MLTRFLPALVCLLGLVSASAGADPDDDYGPVGAFRLTERDGRTVSADDLLGKVWVASFQFTRCTGQCPQIARTMQDLQEKLRDRAGVRLVTFTVDPRHDDTAELRKYADHFQADPERWLFLTGDEAEVHRLLREGFHVHAAARAGAEGQAGSEVDHSPKLVVVDRRGHVRGYYTGLRQPPLDSPEEFESEMKRLRRQVDHLLLPESPWYLPADFPAFNATLNALSAVLITAGYLTVRRRLYRLHAACMLTAVGVSALFLASYLYFHIVIKGGRPTRFADQAIGSPEWVQYLYLGVLGTHTVLAVAATPMALASAYLGLRGSLRRHVALARWTLPVWLYVSVTGVVVYWMLYRLYP